MCNVYMHDPELILSMGINIVVGQLLNGHQCNTVTIVRPSIMIVGCVGLTPPIFLVKKSLLTPSGYRVLLVNYHAQLHCTVS